ncbi:hypothetical protein D3O61_21615 [Vibrio vulnificus]|nr:hypothetical protein [Vibrio vulnificus]
MPNKAFKSDSQRLAVSLRSSLAKRRSHLNAALCSLGNVKAEANLLIRKLMILRRLSSVRSIHEWFA